MQKISITKAPVSVLLPPVVNACSANAAEPSPAELEAEIKELAKNFGQNTRVARKYRKDKEKILAFLKLIREIGTPAVFAQKLNRQPDTPPGEAEAAQETITFTRTVEQLSEQSGLSAHEVDKYLKWGTIGLGILTCDIPKDKKFRDRVITLDPRTVQDLNYLLDPTKRVGMWDIPVEVAENDFNYKSLSAFALNHTIGCMFGCLFCYVPSTSTVKLGWRLIRFGILDADAEWGTYCLIRRWDEDHFRKSLRRMLALPASELAPDGHTAIMMSTNTDAYQPVIHPDPVMRKKLQEYLRSMVRRTLEILLEPEFARLNLRIQTRGLAAEGDFDLMQKFGNRILFGMSVPTLNNALARIYEPKAPAPTRPEIPGMKKSPPGRLELLKKAMDMGIPGYVAMAPTFPECDEADLRKTLTAFSKLPLHTIFHEAINARAENVDRILEEAKRQEKTTAAEVIRHPATQIPYAIEQMKLVEKIATELGIGDKLHLWPDAELLAQKVVDAQPDPDAFRTWLRRWHGRISEWPGYDGPRDYDPYQAKQTTQDPTDDLTATEKKTLAKAVTAVKGLSRSEYKAGNALRLIIDRRLHRPASFEDFCQARFGFSRQHGYHLIDFAVLTDNVSTTVDKNRLPTHERQARGIMKAFRDSPEQQQAAWLRACEMAGGVPGSDVVMAAVDELVKKDEPADPKPAAPPARNPKAARVFKIVDALENAIGTGVDHVGIQRLVDQLKGELEAIFGKAA